MTSDHGTTLDAIGLEVLWNRLISVCNEQAVALIRTSFSTVLRESEDLSAGVFDARGNMIAQSVTGTPGHINSMATSMHHFRRVFPTEELEPGDILITNDPWFTSGQLNDLTIVTPVFRGGSVVAFFGNTCHAADIGGRGLAADARDVYEEGLAIPIMKLYERGEPNRDLFALIEENVRTPDVILGDIHAQVACNDVGGHRLLEFMDDFGLETIEGVSDQILDRSEAAMRDAFCAMPDGVYENETFSDGFLDDDPIRLVCAIEVDGDSIVVDFDGTSPESKLGINVVLNYTLAYTTFCFKAAVNPEVPNNEGSFRPVEVRAPPGCILNAQRPAPVAGRHIIGHLVPSLLFGALAKIVPEQVTAEGAAGIWISQMRGFDERGQFTFALFSCGGTGARPSKDGLGNTGFPSGVAGIPAEVVETVSPLILHRREIRQDSGGPGTFRGGVGQTMRVGIRSASDWIVSSQADRVRFPPRGYLGGADGAKGDFWLSDGSRVDPKLQRRLPPEAEIFLSLPGGGGYYPPLERDPDAVLQDVVEGHVSIEAAERDYGVVIRRLKDVERLIHLPEDYELDLAATRRLRDERART